MRISEVSRRSGVSATALRYYEKVGLITADRSRNGYRDYTEDILTQLDLIETSKELGLPLAEISQHLSTVRTRSCTAVRDHLEPLLAVQLRRLVDKRDRLERLQRHLAAAHAGLSACPDRDDRCSSKCVLRASPGHTQKGPAQGADHSRPGRST